MTAKENLTIGSDVNLQEFPSSVTVTGKDALLIVTQAMTVGQMSYGKFNVQSKAKADVGSLFLGLEQQVLGTATVSGSESSLLVRATSIVGSRGKGELSIEGGAAVRFDDDWFDTPDYFIYWIL